MEKVKNLMVNVVIPLMLVAFMGCVLFGDHTPNERYIIHQNRVGYLTNSYEFVNEGKCIKFIDEDGSHMLLCGTFHIRDIKASK